MKECSKITFFINLEPSQKVLDINFNMLLEIEWIKDN